MCVGGTSLYLYRKNLQGDITGIYSGSTGTLLVSYVYDAWGKPTVTNETGTTESTNLISNKIVSTGKHVLGTNTFTYCYNNPNTYVDNEGTDAILLLSTESFQHLGLLIQDSDGTWWHFYWGAKDMKEHLFELIIGGGVEATTWCVRYDGEISLQAINQSGQYKGGYECMLRLQGDFSKSVEVARNISSDEKYYLYVNNCSQ